MGTSRGTTETATVTSGEYAARLAAVRERMAECSLAALFVGDPANIYYLTGYNAWSFYTPQVLLVPAHGDVHFFTRAMDAQGAHRTANLDTRLIHGYPEPLVHRPDVHPFDWVSTRIRELGLVNGPAEVAMELDAHFTSPRAYLSLRDGLPEWSIGDSRELVNWVRLVKSDTEIALMRAAGAVATAAMNAAIGTIGAGVRQSDAAAAIAHAQYAGTPEAAGDYTAIVPMMPTGEAADTPHLTWTGEPFDENVSVVVELSGAHRRYHVPLARTLQIGTPEPRMRDLAAVVAEGAEAVLADVRPGVVVSDIVRTWDGVLAQHGLSKASRIGYSIGIGYPPDWGERTVSLRADDDTVLAENMTFHFIFGMWMEGYGYELSEPLRVAKDGVETFTSFPRTLITAEG